MRNIFEILFFRHFIWETLVFYIFNKACKTRFFGIRIGYVLCCESSHGFKSTQKPKSKSSKKRYKQKIGGQKVCTKKSYKKDIPLRWPSCSKSLYLDQMPSKAALTAYNSSMEHHEKQLTNSSDDTTLKLSIDQSDPGKKTVFTKEELFGASCEYAETLMKRTYSTNVSCLTPDNSTPKFELDNFTLGRVLGRGTYGVVQEVIGLSDPKYKVISPKKNKSKKKLTPSVSLDDVQSPINKSTVAKQCFREDGASRYAIKYLSDKVLDDTNLCYRAIIDMTLDTHFLSKLDHPNILKLRAISGSGPFSRTNFILLDRLDDTLEKRIPALRKKLPKLKAVFNKKKKNLLFHERLCYAYEIATSIQHIHSLK